MLKILLICGMRLRLLAGTPLRVIMIFVLPCLFMMAVNVPFSEKLDSRNTIVVVDNDQTWLSAQLIQNLKLRSGLRVETGSLKVARRMISRRQAVNAYRILPGFQHALLKGEIPKIEKWSTRMPMNDLPFVAVTAQVSRLLTVVRTTQAVMAMEYPLSDTKVDTAIWKQKYNQLLNVSEANLPSVAYIAKTGEVISVHWVAGFTDGPFGMLLTFIALMLGYALTMLVKERETVVALRVKLVVGKKTQIIGDAMGLVLVLLGQAGVALLMWSIFLQETLALPACYISLIIVFFGLLISSFVMYISSNLVRSAESLQNFYAPMIVILSLMGGCFFSGELLPANIKLLTWFSPQGLAMNAYRAWLTGDYLIVVLALVISLSASFFFMIKAIGTKK